MKSDRRHQRVFFDTETTGLDPARHEVISFGAVVEEHLPGGSPRALSEHSITIKPKNPERADEARDAQSKTAREVNGFREEAWAAAPPFEEVAEVIFAILDGRVLVGQNPSFDRNFLIAEFCRAGREDLARKLPHHLVDLVTLSHEYLKPVGLRSLSLDSVRKFLGMPPVHPHTALQDARDTRAAYHRLRRRAPLYLLLGFLRGKAAAARRGFLSLF